MSRENEKEQFNVRIPSDLVRKMRVYAAQEDISLADAAQRAMEDFLSDKKLPKGV